VTIDKAQAGKDYSVKLTQARVEKGAWARMTRRPARPHHAD